MASSSRYVAGIILIIVSPTYSTLRLNDPERSIRVTRECCSCILLKLWLTLCCFIKVIGAHGLVKRELLSLPDPFAVLTVDGEQTSTTAIIRKTLSPSWEENFDV